MIFNPCYTGELVGKVTTKTTPPQPDHTATITVHQDGTVILWTEDEDEAPLIGTDRL